MWLLSPATSLQAGGPEASLALCAEGLLFHVNLGTWRWGLVSVFQGAGGPAPHPECSEAV